jgi:hypothetical protein
VTIESNRAYPDISKAPFPAERITRLKEWEGKRMITVEPVMDFDLGPFIGMISEAGPAQVNIGADSKNKNLPEPPPEKIQEFISALETFTKVHIKPNLGRLLGDYEHNKEWKEDRTEIND